MAAWDDDPVVGRSQSLQSPAMPAAATAAGVNAWDADPVMGGPSAQARAAVTANDNAEDAGRAYKIGKKLGISPQLVQDDVPAYGAAERTQTAVEAAKIPALAKYINDNPSAASVSSDDWPMMIKASDTWEGLKSATVGGISMLKALSKIDMAGERGFKEGFGTSTPTGVSDEFIEGMQKLGLVRRPGDPAQVAPLLSEALVMSTAALINNGLRTISGLVHAGAETGAEVVRQAGTPLDDEFGGREASAQRFKNEALNLTTYLMSGQAGHVPVVGELTAKPQYLTTEQFLNRVQALTDREAIDTYLRSKEPQQGPLLMITKAEHASEALDKAVEVAQESKTKERSPDLYAAAGAAHGDEVLHIPANKILDLYNKAGKAPAEGDGLFGFVPDLAKKLESATAAGAEISIPASQYIAHVDPAVHDALREDVRLHDDGVTLTEAKEVEDAFKASKEEPLETITQSVVRFKNGEEYAGALHSDAVEAFQAAHPEIGPDEAYKMMLDQGFQTSTGRYVSREEALQVARKADQGISRDVEGTGLVAEDIVPPDQQSRDIIERNMAPVADTTKGKPGANTGRLARLLGPKLYGEPSNMTTVSVKEMMQNAFDAIKGHLEKGKIKEGKIEINLDRKGRSITVYDNGSGMSPAVLGKEFLEIAGTSKETEAASGGLGIAKMMFLFGNKELKVMTLRDGKLSTMTTTGDNLFKAMEGDASLAPDIETRIMSNADRKLFPDGHGTIVSVKVPESYKDASTGEEKKIPFDTWVGSHPVIQTSPLFNNIEVKLNGNVLPIGKNFPVQDFTQFANVNFEWGTARIYVSKVPHGEKYGENMHILSNGLWQFSSELKKDPRGGWGPNIEHDFYVDVSPKVAPDQPGYPFELSRQGFSPATKKDFGKIFQYIQRTYQALDFATSAKNFGDIEYLDRGDTGELEISGKQKLEPEGAKQAVDEAALKQGDQVEVKDGKLLVGGREIPELKPEDLSKNNLDVNKMMIDQGLIDPHRVMMHDNIEVRVKTDKVYGEFEQTPFGEETSTLSDEWVSLVDTARERFPERFDSFMFEVGDAFMQLRAEVAVALDYSDLLAEGIGISFDPEYRGVSIRLPFSASFINPAVPVYTDPVRAAVGTIGTMIHELAHHKVRSHDAEFPAEMQKIQIFLDTNEILVKTEGPSPEGDFSLSELKQHMVSVYEQYHDVFLWLNKQITEGTDATVRSRGKRFKESGEVTGRDAGAAGDVGQGGDGGLGPSYQRVKGGEGDGTAPSDPEGPGAIAGGVEEAVKAEKRQLYLSPMFKDAKAVGLTAGEFSRYSRKLEKADNDILDRAIKLHRGQIKKALSAEWKRDEAKLTEQVTADLKAQGPFAAERFLRENKIKLAAENADEFATIFGYTSGADLLANLSAMKASNQTIETQFKNAVKAQVDEQMKAKHGDLASKIAAEAREVATDGHTFDVLDFELRTLANAGKLPPPVEKEALVAQAKGLFENGLLTDGANYAKLRRAVERGGREAEKALLKGDFLEAFHAKQQQFVAAVLMRESNRLQRTIDSVEKKIDKFTSQQVVPSLDQAHLEQIRGVLDSVGVPQNIAPTIPPVPLTDFVADSEGQLAVAAWLMTPKPPQLPDMTVAQFRDLQKSLRSLEHVGAQAKQLESAHGKADLDNVVFDIVKELDRFPLVHQPNIDTIGTKARGLFRQIIGAHLLVERLLDYTDQFNPEGPITQYLDRPLRDSNVKELELTERVSRELRALKPLTDTSINEIVENSLFQDKRDKTGFLKMNRQNVRMVAFNMGNRSNIAKVTEGFNIDEKDVRRWLDKNMRDQDWEWVQGMWSMLAWLKKEADAMQLRDTGVPSDTLEPVQINGKTGGYAPIVYSRDGSNIAGHIAAKNPIFAPTYYTATTPQGYTIARTAFAAPLDLNGTFLPSKIQAMVHDIAFREAVRNASKLINHPDFNAAVAQKWSSEYKDLLHGWLKDIANSHLIDDAYAQDWARGISILRHNVTSTLIAMNPGTFIKHGFTAMGMSVERVGARNIAGAAFEIGPGGFAKSAVDLIKKNDIVPNDAFIAAYRDVMDQGERGEDARNFILQSSAVMRNRQRTYQDTIRGAYEESTRAGLGKGFSDFRQTSMMIGRVPVAFSDALSALPTWLAAYRTAFEKGKSHADSVFIADKEVSRAHGSSFIGDKPRVSRLPNTIGGEVLKTFVGLYNFWNHSFNNQIQMAWDLASKTRDDVAFEGQPSPQLLDMLKKEDGEWYYRPEPNAAWSSLSKRLALILGTIMIEEMATAPLDDSHHGLLARASLAFIRYAGSGIVGLREVTTAFAHGYEPSTGMIGTMSRGAAQIGKDIKNMGTGKALSKDWMTHFATALGFISGVGGSQYGRTATGVTGMITGRDTPKTFNQLRQTLRTGHTKPRVH